MMKPLFQETFPIINHLKTHKIIFNCIHRYQTFNQECMMKMDSIKRLISPNTHLKSIKSLIGNSFPWNKPHHLFQIKTQINSLPHLQNLCNLDKKKNHHFMILSAIIHNKEIIKFLINKVVSVILTIFQNHIKKNNIIC